MAQKKSHVYANDSQIYISNKPTNSLPFPELINCLQDMKHFLKLNCDKTELMLVGYPRLSSPRLLISYIDGIPIIPSTIVRNLGVTLDSTFFFSSILSFSGSSLLWLLVRANIHFKILNITYKAHYVSLHTAPNYLSSPPGRKKTRDEEQVNTVVCNRKPVFCF